LAINLTNSCKHIDKYDLTKYEVTTCSQFEILLFS